MHVNAEVVIITGMSGAGRTEAMHILEDMSYYCIDNLPPSLLSQLVDLVSMNAEKPPRLALVCDLRTRNFADEFAHELEKMKAHGAKLKVIFLDASDEMIRRRYSTLRRRHPCSDQFDNITQAIAFEREKLYPTKQLADHVIDTTHLKPQTLRNEIKSLLMAETGESTKDLRVTVFSFGFKHGLPKEADIIIDVRFLPNPYYLEELKSLSGLDQAVRDYVFAQPETQTFLSAWRGLLDVCMPGYLAEGKQHLSIGVGCTGGQHRSVSIALDTAQHLRDQGYLVRVFHREMDGRQ